MKTKKLGWTELEISVLGLGTSHLNGGSWKVTYRPDEDKESIATILYALENSINWIDTAPLYCRGHSEEIVASAIKKYRKHPIIVTKCGRLWNENGLLYSSLKPASIRKEVEASIKRLNVEVIDLYLIHWPKPESELVEAWVTIADLVKEGKVRYGGVSNFNTQQLKKIHAHHPIAVIQQPYNMLNRDVEKEILTFCRENNIGFMAYSPLQKGLLSGKFTGEKMKTLPTSDNRKTNPYFTEPALSKNLSFVEKLQQLSMNVGISVAQLAVSWVLKCTEVTGAIIGAKNVSQVEELLVSEEVTLSIEVVNMIEKLIRMLG